MNKIASLLSLTALTMGFVACDEVEDIVAEPSTNPQETIFNASDLTVTPAAGTLNLQALAEGAQPAQVATVAVKDFPEASTLKLIMEIGSDADFTKYADMSTKIDSTGNVTVDAQALDALYYDKITRNPAQADVPVRFIAEAVNGTEVVRIGDDSTFFGAGTIALKPFDAVEDTYYIWSAELEGTPIKMLHSEEAAYEDPVFSIVVDVPADGLHWAIIPGSDIEGTAGTHTGKVFVPQDSEATSGKLVAYAASDDYTPGYAMEEGPYKIEVNMHTLSYKVSLAIKQLYTPGATNGWVFDASQVLTTPNYVNYAGFAHLFGEYKFAAQPSWEGIVYGKGEEDGQLSTDPEAKNLKASPNGLYYCTVNVISLTYKNTRVETLGLVGSMTGWSADPDIEMAHSTDYLTWTATATFAAGDEFKFRANSDWGINLGGTPEGVYQDGANIKVEEAGTYVITLDLSAVPYTYTMNPAQED